MDKTKTAKAAVLLIAVVTLCISLHDVADWSAVGIYKGCSLVCRMLYPFFHANLLHVTLNVWCLLSVVFIYDVSLWRLFFAYAIAVATPSCFLMDTPTVGLSGVVYVLFGTISFEVRRKLYYQLWMFFYVVIGFFFPNTNTWIHLYCYLAGCVVALFNKPVKVG